MNKKEVPTWKQDLKQKMKIGHPRILGTPEINACRHGMRECELCGSAGLLEINPDCRMCGSCDARWKVRMNNNKEKDAYLCDRCCQKYK